MTITRPAELTATAEDRIARLASVIEARSFYEFTTIAILCCEDHADDAAAANRAGELLGRPVLNISTSISPSTLAEVLIAGKAKLLLACTEGTELWRKSGVNIVVLGDGPGVFWWRMAELRAHRQLADTSHS
jgi:hypothetical protein